MKKILIVSLFALAPSFAFASFDTNLQYGSSGPKVLELQEFLAAQGVYTGPITGNFYSLTLAGVKAFQTKQNVSPVSGFFGPLTRTEANKILNAQIQVSLGAAVQETGTTTEPVVEDFEPNQKVVQQVKYVEVPVVKSVTNPAKTQPSIDYTVTTSQIATGTDRYVVFNFSHEMDGAHIAIYDADGNSKVQMYAHFNYSDDPARYNVETGHNLKPGEYSWIVVGDKKDYPKVEKRGSFTISE